MQEFLDETGGIKDWVKKQWNSLFVQKQEFKFRVNTVERYTLPTKPLNI